MWIIWLACLYYLSNNVTAVHSYERIKHDAFQHTLGHLKPRAQPDVQAEAAREVLRRLLGDSYKLFPVSVDSSIGPVGKDTFHVFKSTLGQIMIIGTSGVAAVWGFHYYVKNFCDAHIAWEESHIELPNHLPDVDIKITSNDRFRYYQNVCTAGYSTAWWDWPKWEKHIDWMALNGINLALAFHAQEAIWERVYTKLNLTRHDIDEHFGGPAFLPWARMGNIRGWGGPLTSAWHNHTVKLQHKILNRMRELGIIPVLPAFSGQVPRAFSTLFPTANLTKFEPWNRFSEKYCCPFLLLPTDPLFKTVGTMFLSEYIQEFGTDHVYNCDTFNENEPPQSDLDFLSGISRSIYSAITDVDPEGIWILQGWLFLHELSFWTNARVEAFLTAVPIGKLIVLDLQSEQFPQYERLSSYYGQPFIWCMLHNFGGTLGLFGSAEIINKRVFEGRNMKNSTMIGTGLAPEGINQNYVVYDLMNEMAYLRNPADLDAWFERYAARRYGAWNEYAVQAWQKLRLSVYSFTGLERIRGKYTITRRPSLKINPWVGRRAGLLTWYDTEIMLSAWDDIVKARHGRRNNTFYQHDVVDITRQALQLTANTLYLNIKTAVNHKNISQLRKNAKLFTELFDDLERILASNKDFLLGTWLQDAKSLATDEKEKKLYEFNARNQITLWGPRGEIRDYANKQWSGVVADYYKPRWVVLLDELENSLANGTPLNSTAVDFKIFNHVEQPFTLSNKIYPVTANGDSVEIAVELNKKWRKIKPSSKIRITGKRNFGNTILDRRARNRVKIMKSMKLMVAWRN
ncbi:alpha-N-acetylglucosaminidase isoform X1 [Neodiprion virginianus]|uniref:alpha-N-acetylglucosaminidase isoform X1 n=2 Tax=Neodiprion virginianus TaxID=2961670 RepID=UPI001EE718BA|nr:alpha-N-acetylglucosaminidase isoform X1 [Neodiprion virginianus]